MEEGTPPSPNINLVLCDFLIGDIGIYLISKKLLTYIFTHCKHLPQTRAEISHQRKFIVGWYFSTEIVLVLKQTLYILPWGRSFIFHLFRVTPTHPWVARLEAEMSCLLQFLCLRLNKKLLSCSAHIFHIAFSLVQVQNYPQYQLIKAQSERRSGDLTAALKSLELAMNLISKPSGGELMDCCEASYSI